MRYVPEEPIGGRRLVLDDGPGLGRSAAPDEFEMHGEFWSQLCTIYNNRHQRSLTDTVSTADAHALAEMLRASADDESWQFHLYFWGDEDGHAVRQFIDYLASGGFVVVRR